MDNYIQLIGRISQLAHLPLEDIERKIEAKRAKLSGLVSKEGAAQIIAAELGVNFEKERIKLSELVQGMKRAHVTGKVVEVFPIRTYTKNGKEGKVATLVLADDTTRVRTVLWDMTHIALVERGEIKEGDVVEISNAGVRNGELHLSAFADIKQSGELFKDVASSRMLPLMKLGDAKPGQSLKTRAFIVQIFEPRYFEVCPECGKKVAEGACAMHGTVVPNRRALLSIVLDDGTESLRSVFFGEQILKLGLSEEDIFSLERFHEKKGMLLGEEKFFSGNIKNNTLFNTVELTVESVDDVQPELLVRELGG